jgi:hypothetical protein
MWTGLIIFLVVSWVWMAYEMYNAEEIKED